MLRKSIKTWDNLWNCTQSGQETSDWLLTTTGSCGWDKYATNNTAITDYTRINLVVGGDTEGQVVGFATTDPKINAMPSTTYQNITIGLYYDSNGYCGVMTNGFGYSIITCKIGDILQIEYDNGKVTLSKNNEPYYVSSKNFATMYWAVASYNDAIDYKIYEDNSVAKALITKVITQCGEADFDGSSSYGYLPFTLLPRNENFTLEIKFFPKEFNLGMLISDLEDDYSYSPCFQLYLGAGGFIHLAIGNGTFYQDIPIDSYESALKINDYNIVTVSRIGDNILCKVNDGNEKIMPVHFKDYFKMKHTRPYLIGRRAHNDNHCYYKGRISYIRVFDGKNKLLHAYEMRNITKFYGIDNHFIDEIGTLEGVFYGSKISYGEQREILTHGYCNYVWNGSSCDLQWGIQGYKELSSGFREGVAEYDGKLSNQFDGNMALAYLGGLNRYNLPHSGTEIIRWRDDGGIKLDGLSSFIQVTSSDMLNIFKKNNSDKPISEWGISISFIPQSDVRQNLWQITGGGFEFELGICKDGLVGFYINGYIINYNLPDIKVNLNEINNISVTTNVSSQVKICVNGKIYTWDACNTQIDPVNFFIGKAVQNVVHFEGIITKFRMFDFLLTDQQMRALWNCGKPI